MELIFPILFISLGLAMVIYPGQLGRGFCKLGKATWKVSTFGLTDMRWFYPEDKAPKIFRLMGIFWILFGVIFLSIIGVSYFGPNGFAAMREAKIYLKEHHGDSSTGWSFSFSEGDQGMDSVIVRYRYGEHSGSLMGIWNGDQYEFVEQIQKAEQGGAPNPLNAE